MIISKREQKNQQSKDKLLSALESIVAKYGYDQVNIRAICKISGVSYGSFYNLFENKDKFLVYYLTNDFAKFKDAYYSQNEGFADQSPLEKIVDIYRCCGFYNLSKGVEFISAFYSPHNYSLYIPNAYNKNDYYSFTPLYEESLIYLEQAFSQWDVHTKEHRENVARRFCVLFNGATFNWCISKGELDLMHEIEYMFKLYMAQLKSE